MDIAADSCKSFLDQFLQEREPTALAEGGIMAIINPHDTLMNWFLNEQEPTAPPVDGYEGTNTSPAHFKCELPSEQQSLQMEQWGLAPVLHCNQVLHTYMPWHLVWAVNAISVVEMGILNLVCQIEVASVLLKQTADMVGWPTHWFANLAMDLNQLNSLILVTVSHASYTLPLPLIPLSTFCIINNISAIDLHWTPHTADPNSGFAFPWWLYHSKEYAVDSQRLQGKGLFSVAWDFFKLMMAQDLWRLPEAPIANCLNGHIEEQVVGIAWVVGCCFNSLHVFDCGVGFYDAHPLALSMCPIYDV
ncbi:hypothetical protein F5J12DRAFT_784507 [Pisolithus orientalis]|uniref:uncharacterized protein n=1 Tax=Pisolithus orientalis TaxID=936130 RepID=UPI00222464A5|nr:uncharacterized protein F5J12DRAFT_784507 [Pisolithus orientalis]KAI6000203.1 hypothetical protein F5J12DRAFT_784507 [Pisolithus orientalis]